MATAPDDDLDHLVARLRATPPAASVEQVSPGLETRVLARVRAARGSDSPRWFWRWSAVFAAAAIACAAAAINQYQALIDDPLLALEHGAEVLTWSF